MTHSPSSGPSDRHPAPERLVTIFINHAEVRLRAGVYTVVELKALGGVAASDELSLVVHGQPKLLEPHQSVPIKGGEGFISNAPVGASS